MSDIVLERLDGPERDGIFNGEVNYLEDRTWNAIEGRLKPYLDMGIDDSVIDVETLDNARQMIVRHINDFSDEQIAEMLTQLVKAGAIKETG